MEHVYLVKITSNDDRPHAAARIGERVARRVGHEFGEQAEVFVASQAAFQCPKARVDFDPRRSENSGLYG